MRGRIISPINDENRKNKEELNQIGDHWKLHDLIRKTDCKESIENPTAAFMKYGVSLRILVTQMRRVKWCFHFTRNNPNHTKRFYFRLKAIVGIDKWPLVSPDVRQAWEDAANRFDMQYGLVRAWAMTPWVLEPNSKLEKPNDPPFLQELIDSVNAQKDAVERLTKLLSDSPKIYIRKLYKMNDAVKKAQEAAEDALKTLNVYQQRQ